MRIKLAIATLLLLTAPAAAGDDHLTLLATGGWMMPRGEVAESLGGGAELRFVEDQLMIGVGASALYGSMPAMRRRDVMDVRVDGTLRLCKDCDGAAPYVGLGLDVLHVTTHEPGRSVRGSTLGLSAHAGLVGETWKDEWMWRAGVSYLGAIVPGTGEDLGGITFTIGLGKQIAD
jgi:hypothetical protein